MLGRWWLPRRALCPVAISNSRLYFLILTRMFLKPSSLDFIYELKGSPNIYANAYTCQPSGRHRKR